MQSDDSSPRSGDSSSRCAPAITHTLRQLSSGLSRLVLLQMESLVDARKAWLRQLEEEFNERERALSEASCSFLPRLLFFLLALMSAHVFACSGLRKAPSRRSMWSLGNLSMRPWTRASGVQ